MLCKQNEQRVSEPSAVAKTLSKRRSTNARSHCFLDVRAFAWIILTFHSKYKYPCFISYFISIQMLSVGVLSFSPISLSSCMQVYSVSCNSKRWCDFCVLFILRNSGLFMKLLDITFGIKFCRNYIWNAVVLKELILCVTVAMWLCLYLYMVCQPLIL